LIAEGRGIPRSTVERAIDRGFQTPEEARRCGLVDAVEYQDQFKSWLESQYPGKKLEILTKYGRPQGADLDLNNPFAVFTQIAQLMNPKTDDKGGEKAPRIALIYAVGAITSGKSQVDPFSGASSSMGSETMVAAIRKAAEDDSVKAIVMRVDSPGGSGLASDMIWREVVRAKAKKPFVVSMSDVAGSGGYYIAMAADSIIAEPTTLTGSIGVVSMFIDMTRLIRRVGINVETVSRGKSAGMFSPFTRKSDEQRQRFAGYMEAFYRDFVSKVAEGRGMSFEDTEKLARGRVWTGRQAKEIGLVDELGGLELAFSLARKKAGLPEDCEVIELPQPRNFFEVLSEMFGGGGLIGLTGSDRDGLLAALPAEARLLLATDEGREVLDKIRTVLGVAMDENDRRLLLVPFDIVIR
jgi:protease-4